MLTTPLALLLFAGVEVESQHLEVALDPAAHTVAVAATLHVTGDGQLRLRLNDLVEIERVTALGTGRKLTHSRFSIEGDAEQGVSAIAINVPAGAAGVTIAYGATFEQDVAAGEIPGQIHNFAVNAHLGENGIFLSDGSAWHPQPIDADNDTILHVIDVQVEPIEGWTVIASGDPVHEGENVEACWEWKTPRGVDGMAIVGNRHVTHGVVHETSHGPVEIVMHVPEEHAQLAPMFVGAAQEYLDLYVPLLGPFPYKRFSIVENFFSSGFAFPGFTVLGPRVVGMAPRSLLPGFLDHEMIHNWWGNGVYVDSEDGNWCEALTSYCANYYRRIADDGEEAGREYRRGTLMKLSADPENLDNGPLGEFGSADPSEGGPDRFVGYDKGAFVFMMLEDVLAPNAEGERGPMWASLRHFARENLGRRANWLDLQKSFEAQQPDNEPGWLDGYFEFWVRQHSVPQTIPGKPADAPIEFANQFPADYQNIHLIYGPNEEWCEIDPDFELYRVLPPEQTIPTITGTFGKGGCIPISSEERADVIAYMRQVMDEGKGDNLLIIGVDSILTRLKKLIEPTSDPIDVGKGWFIVGGKKYDKPTQSVLHTMQYPGRPGYFISVYHANGPDAWGQLRLIRHYSRDTTVIWDGRQVIERRVFEPDRRIVLDTP